MACRGFIRVLLEAINFLFILVGLVMIGYGVYMFFTWNSSSSSSSPPPPPPSSSLSYWNSPPPPPSESSLNYWTSSPSVRVSSIERVSADGATGVLQIRRLLFQEAPKVENIALSSFWSSLPSAWFIYLFIAAGVAIALITCSGCIAAATSNGCCLSCYSFFIVLVMIVELALAAFIFFDDNWQEVIPDDSTGELDSIESFITDKIDIFKWVALAIVILEALALLLAIILRSMGSQAKDYDSDDEFVAPRARQPLLNRAPTSGTGSSAAGSDGRPARTDAWSTRMREKYGLDTTEFSYNPVEPKRQPQTAATEDRKSCCCIM